MQPHTPTLRNRRGVALVMALLIVFICSTVLLGLVTYTVSDYRATHLDERKVQALYCAEAGIEYAVDFVRRGETLPGSEVALSDAGFEDAEGSFKISAQAVQSATVTDPKNSIRVTSTGFIPSEDAVLEGRGVKRTVVAILAPGEWSFGLDAVRSRNGVDYGSNQNMTLIVDDSNNVISPAPLTVNASVRVTGTDARIEGVKSKAANKAKVAGSVIAPGGVDIAPGCARSISQNDPNNFLANAFPDQESLGYTSGAGATLVWPPAPGSFVSGFYEEAVAGGVSVFPSGTIQAPKYVEMGGVGSLSGVTLKGPGTIFVHGNLGGGVINGPPPVQLVVTGNFSGNLNYTCNRGASGPLAPPLIIFGPDIECKGSASWDLGGPLMAMHPEGTVLINDSAMSIFGALISNGSVYFKSNGGALGFPARFTGQRFTMPTPVVVRSYSTSYSGNGEDAQWKRVGRPAQ